MIEYFGYQLLWERCISKYFDHIVIPEAKDTSTTDDRIHWLRVLLYLASTTDHEYIDWICCAMLWYAMHNTTFEHASLACGTESVRQVLTELISILIFEVIFEAQKAHWSHIWSAESTAVYRPPAHHTPCWASLSTIVHGSRHGFVSGKSRELGSSTHLSGCLQTCQQLSLWFCCWHACGWGFFVAAHQTS